MKYAILFLVLITATARAQPAAADSMVAMKRTTLVNVANKFRLLEFRYNEALRIVAIDDSLIVQRTLQIRALKEQGECKDSMISTVQMQFQVCKTNEQLHIQTEQALRAEIVARSASFYTAYLLPALAGLGVGYLLFH